MLIAELLLALLLLLLLVHAEGVSLVLLVLEAALGALKHAAVEVSHLGGVAAEVLAPELPRAALSLLPELVFLVLAALWSVCGRLLGLELFPLGLLALKTVLLSPVA